jgi:hypothetical protein
MSPRPDAPARLAWIRRLSAGAAAGLLAFTLSACTEPPTGTLHTRAGYTAVVEDVPVSICPEADAARLSDDEGVLVGAHFALKVECVATFTEFPEGYQLEYLFGEDVSLFGPEPGNEFVLVQFAPQHENEALFSPDSQTELDAVLDIGGQTWEFDGEVPVDGSAYFAVVESDAAITLEVTNTGLTQSLDMRERTRDGLVQALYHGSSTEVTTETVEGKVDAFLRSGSWEYTVTDWGYATEFVVSRTVYEPGEGWVAEPDRVKLEISWVWLQEANDLVWSIDPEKTLKVTGPDGALEPTEVDKTEEKWGDGGKLVYYDMYYDVPADALEFDLEFAPKGPIHWNEHNVNLPITKGEKTHKVKADFS